MIGFRAAFIGFWLVASIALAGPFAPRVGQPGTTAIARTDAGFRAWASRVANYSPGTNLTPPWNRSERALGPADTLIDHVVSLGSGGSITVAFDGVIVDGPGADFAVFENGFGDFFIECAFVEVSADGVHFVRFPGQSLTAAPVSSFGVIEPTDITQLGSKYRVGYGEPYDLATVGLSHATHVRLIDIVGDGSIVDSQGRPVYDPTPVAQSAGFDLDAVGALNFRTWFMLPMGSLSSSAINAVALSHLPDGRALLGRQGSLFVQSGFGSAALTLIPANGVTFDPAFIAVRNSSTAIIGAGGGFSGTSGLHPLNPSTPAVGITSSPLAPLQNFTGAYWKSPTSSLEGWLVGGTNHPSFDHDVRFVSLDGTRVGPVTEPISAFSAGIAVDAEGNLYAASYTIAPIGDPMDNNRVFRFSAAQMESAVTAVMAQSPTPIPLSSAKNLFQFDGASSLTVDGWGRVWATGFTTSQIQVFDPATGAHRRFTPDHDPLPGVVDPIYQLNAFSRDGIPHLGLLVKDEAGTAGTPLELGMAPLSALRIPVTALTWRQNQFGTSASNPSLESTVWGDLADPDYDGRANLLERGLGQSGVDSDARAPVTVQLTEGRMEAIFSFDPDAVDLTFVVEASPSLASASWTELAQINGMTATPANASTLVTITSSGRLAQCSVTDPTVLTGLSTRFLRLRVVSAP